MADAIAALPQVLATALAAAPAAAAGQAAAPAATTRDRKVPDFWDEAPKAWFRILDRHFATVSGGNLTETHKFLLMLPLIRGAAVKKVQRLVQNPP